MYMKEDETKEIASYNCLKYYRFKMNKSNEFARNDKIFLGEVFRIVRFYLGSISFLTTFWLFQIQLERGKDYVDFDDFFYLLPKLREYLNSFLCMR